MVSGMWVMAGSLDSWRAAARNEVSAALRVGLSTCPALWLHTAADAHTATLCRAGGPACCCPAVLCMPAIQAELSLVRPQVSSHLLARGVLGPRQLARRLVSSLLSAGLQRNSNRSTLLLAAA